jgi:hypothetical protein
VGRRARSLTTSCAPLSASTGPWQRGGRKLCFRKLWVSLCDYPVILWLPMAWRCCWQLLWPSAKVVLPPTGPRFLGSSATLALMTVGCTRRGPEALTGAYICALMHAATSHSTFGTWQWPVACSLAARWLGAWAQGCICEECSCAAMIQHMVVCQALRGARTFAHCKVG